MPTLIGDFAGKVIAQVGLSPRTLVASVNGSAGDLIEGDGRCFAYQWVGTVGGTNPTLAGKVQESDDGSSWADVPGASFAPIAGAGDVVEVVNFDRSKRYVRYVGTVGGTNPTINTCVVIVQLKKTGGAGDGSAA